MSKTICSIPGCARAVLARGWCGTHYTRWHRHGDPMANPATRYSTHEESFVKNSKPVGECLIWVGGVGSHGYGVISSNSETILAHRYSWARSNGKVPDNAEVNHKCWNKLCVKLEHLELTTRSENAAYRDGPQVNSTTGLRNVYRHRGKWIVRVKKSGKTHYFGVFDCVDEATNVAEQARKRLFGEYAGLG